jgi:hypothetical protein
LSIDITEEVVGAHLRLLLLLPHNDFLLLQLQPLREKRP